MKQTIRIGKKYIRTDFGFIAILLLLMATSCFALYNSFNLVKNGVGSYYLNRQIMWYGISFFAMYMMTKFQNRVLFQYLDLFYRFLLWILLYLFASKILHSLTGSYLPMASAVNGAVSWLQIPVLGSFQASEFMKIVLIIKTSQTITKFQNKFPHPSIKNDIQLLAEIGRFSLLPMLLVLLQPDTGVFIIIALTLLIILMCSGIRKEYVLAIFAVLILVIALFFLLYFQFPNLLNSFVSQYQLNRIEAWLNPEENILGSSNQLYTALLSLGSAGMTGHGLQANIISIPEAHTDFIFAAFGQCFGLAGTLYILIVCLILDLYLCRMAFNVQNRTDKLIIVGAVAMLFYQQFQNLGMIIGLVPITGITLPLISYGGSSTLSYFLLFGVIMNLSPAARREYKIQVPEFNVDEHFRIKNLTQHFKKKRNK